MTNVEIAKYNLLRGMIQEGNTQTAIEYLQSEPDVLAIAVVDIMAFQNAIRVSADGTLLLPQQAQEQAVTEEGAEEESAVVEGSDAAVPAEDGTEEE